VAAVALVILIRGSWRLRDTTLLAPLAWSSVSLVAVMAAIIHAMRGWPTPFGAALNSTTKLFDENGACHDPKDAWALATVAEQVVEFANMRVRA